MPSSDPVAFVDAALETLPPDPSDLSAGDLERLAAVTQGAARYALDVHRRHYELARALVQDRDIDLRGALAEREALGELAERVREADARLVEYVTRALRARGYGLDALMEGVANPKEQR